MIFSKHILNNYLPKLLLLSLLASSVFAYSGGTGEPNDPYRIADVNDLLALAAAPADYGKCFILTADINMAGQAFTTAIIAPDTNNSNYDFDGTAFTGTFDGNGHKIIGFTINGNSYLGLFGQINSGGSVKNLCLENCSVSSSSDSYYVGGLVGSNGGSIINCFSTGTVSGTSNSSIVGGLVGINDYGNISNCYSAGAVSGYERVGGLVGSNFNGTITNCYSTGTVSGSDGSSCVGGLVGANNGSITNCYSMGTISGSWSVGGLVGGNFGSITNCYSTGAVSGDGYVGGLVGYNDYSGISYCYSTGTVSGTDGVGGLVGCGTTSSVSASFWDVNTSGQTTSSGGIGKTTNEMKTLSTFISAGWNFISVWNIIEDQTYPFFFKKGNYSGGDGTPNNPYKIADVNQLLTLAQTVADYNKCFILTADINMAGRISKTAIIAADARQRNPFTGMFDGNGHKITHFTINGETINGGFFKVRHLALFGQVDTGGSVKNLGLENFSISGSSGSYDVGGLVGWNNGGSISNCYSTGTVSGTDGIGGLVGGNYGSISNCYSTGTVSGSHYMVGGLVGSNGGSITNCYSTGPVSGSQYVGGLVGENYNSSISNCYSTGIVSGSSDVGGLVGQNYAGSIANCYSTGTISGDSNTGGLVGYNYQNGVVNTSFWDVNTSGWSTSAGGTGKTTSEMKTLSTFTSAGWDFSYSDGDAAEWFIQIDEYPILTWQISPVDIYTDGKNNFRDFAVFAQFWMRDDCRMYNNFCDWADLNFDGVVDIYDLKEFMSYWLQSGIYN